MPTIRDGRNRVTVDTNEPRLPAGAGPVERLMASPERLADIAAERAREERAAAAHKAPAGPSTHAASHPRFPLPRDRAERDAAVLEALRATSTVAKAGELLGVSTNRVNQVMRDIRLAGEFPADLDATIKARAAHAASTRTGRAPARRTPEPEAPEALVPATDEAPTTATGPAAAEVATPPEPIDHQDDTPDDVLHAREVEADMARAIYRAQVARDEAVAFDHEHGRLYDALKVAEERAELAGDNDIRAELRQLRRRVAQHLAERTCAA